jgi:hypothetical protein
MRRIEPGIIGGAQGRLRADMLATVADRAAGAETGPSKIWCRFGKPKSRVILKGRRALEEVARPALVRIVPWRRRVLS